MFFLKELQFVTFVQIALSVPNDMLRNVLPNVGLSFKPARIYGRSYCSRKDSSVPHVSLYRRPQYRICHMMARRIRILFGIKLSWSVRQSKTGLVL
jgi:hypothetical protein